MAQKFELKKSLVMKDSEQEVGRTVVWTHADNGEGHFEVEGDQRHSQLLMQEWAMQHCKDVDTPMAKAGEESVNTGDELNEDEARRARRAIARMNYVFEDRPDLPVADRVMPQCMSRPREEIVPVIKRAIRYLGCSPRCRLVVSNTLFENFEISVESDSDWASEQATRRSCSGGYIKVNGVTVGHRSMEQLNVACGRQCLQRYDASPRQWSRNTFARCSFGPMAPSKPLQLLFAKLPRCHNAADMLTHAVSLGELVGGRSDSYGLQSSLISTSSAGRWRGTSRWRGCRRITTEWTVSCLRGHVRESSITMAVTTEWTCGSEGHDFSG